MTLHRTLLTTAVLLASSGVIAQAGSGVSLVSSGTLRDLSGATVGQVSIERQRGVTYVRVSQAEKATGATLELLVSPSTRALRTGDHGGPGQGAVRAGLIEQAHVRYALPASVRPEGLRSVWVWCRSVRLPSARAQLFRARS